jgi:hypothetical protein
LGRLTPPKQPHTLLIPNSRQIKHTMKWRFRRGKGSSDLLHHEYSQTGREKLIVKFWLAG